MLQCKHWLLFLVLWTCNSLRVAAATDVFYHSTLADAQALTEPLAGPPAVPGKDGAPRFVQGPAGPGLRSAGSGDGAAGSYEFPAAGWPAERGTLSFWLGLPSDWGLPQHSMPLLMGEAGTILVQLDLRAMSQALLVCLGKTCLTMSIAHWQAGERHFVAISWEAHARAIRVSLDGVRMSRGTYAPVQPTRFHINSLGTAQANYVAVLSELTIVRTAREDFPEVPEALRAAQTTRVTPRHFTPPTATSLLGTTWTIAEEGAEAVNEVGGNVLAIRVESVGEQGFLLRPASPIALASTTLRLLADVAGGDTGKTTVTFLVRGDDGKERAIPSRQIRGSVWAQVVSDYAGGERRELRSMRPDIVHPRGVALPAWLTGIRLVPQYAGLLYLRNVRPDNVEYLKARRWEIVPPMHPYGVGAFSGGMHPFGSEQPEVRLDWFLPARAGLYRVQWAVSDVYQGPAISMGTWNGTWNPADVESAYTARFALTLPGAGTYWWSVKVWDGQGTFMTSFTAPVGVVRDRQHHPPVPAWGSFPRFTQSFGYIHVDTGVADHVFPTRASAQLRLHIDPVPTAPQYTLRYSIRGSSYTERLAKPRVTERAWAPSETDLTLPLALPEIGAAYDVAVEILDGERLLDRSTLRVGIRDDRAPEPITMPQPTLATTFGPGKIVSMNGDMADWYATVNAPTEIPFEAHYRANIGEWQRLHVTVVRVHTDAADLLPLPGLVHVRSVETRVRLLREARLPYMFAFSMMQFHYDPAWVPFAMEEDMSGLPYVGIHEWTPAYFPSPSAPEYVSTAQTMIRALYARFGNDPLFRGWVHQTDIMFPDQGNRRTGFALSMQRGFVRWLQEHKGLTTLTALNTRYGIHLQTWDEVDIPLPPPQYFDIYSGAPDRFEHQSYRDYWDFRMWVIKHLQNDGWVRFARALGDLRPFGFFAYYHGQEEEEYLADLIALGGFTTMGTEGEPGHGFVRSRTLTPLYSGHPYVSEYQALLPGYKEMEAKDVDHLLVSLLLSGGANINFNMFRHGPYSPPPGSHKVDSVTRGLERQRQWMERLPPFAAAQIYPWKVGSYSFGESGGGNIAQYLWPTHPHHVLKSFMSDVVLAQQKLIFVPVVDGSSHNADFTPAMHQQLELYVRQGGKLVLISPDSARYTRDRPSEQFGLLTALGWHDHSVLEAPVDGTTVVSNRGLFTSAGTLTLGGPLPERVHLPAGAIVEAQFANGQPAVVRWPVGKGEVLLFVRNLNPLENPRVFVDDLFRWAGVPQYVTAPGVWFTYAHNGDVRYLMLYRAGKAGAAQPVTVQIHDLPDGKYQVQNIGPDPLDLGITTGVNWRQGVPVSLANGMVVLRFTPME